MEPPVNKYHPEILAKLINEFVPRINAMRERLRRDYAEGRISAEQMADMTRKIVRLERSAWRSAKTIASRRQRLEHKAAAGFLPTPAVLRRHRLDEATFRAMLAAQGGACAICRQAFAWDRQVKIDHHDPTKTVRALLCHHCNAMLGHADESPAVLAAGIAYLRQHAQVREARNGHHPRSTSTPRAGSAAGLSVR